MENGVLRSLVKKSTAVLALCLGLHWCAVAEQTIKREVLENCSAATEHLSSLRAEEREEFIGYLALILQLRSEGSNGTMQLPTLPGSRGTSGIVAPRIDDSIRPAEPVAKKEARHCAVTLLEKLAPTSFSVVPQLIPLLTKPDLYGIDPSLPERLDQAIQAITISARDNVIQVGSGTLLALVKLLDGETHLYAERVFIEIPNVSIPFLFDQLRVPDAAQRDRLIDLLLLLDPNGDIIAPGLIALLNQADDGLRKRAFVALRNLPNARTLALGPTIARLTDISQEIRRGAEDTLDEWFNGAIPPSHDCMSSMTVHALLEGYLRATPEARKILGDGLVRWGSKDSTSLVRSLLEEAKKRSTDTKFIADVLNLLGRVSVPSDQIGSVLNFLKFSDTSIRLATIRALGGAKQDKTTVVKNFVKIISQAKISSDSKFRERVAREIISSMQTLKIGKEGSALIPFLIEQLKIPAGSEESRQLTTSVLAEIGPDALSAITELGRNKDVHIREVAVETAGKIHPVTQKQALILEDKLKDNEKSVRQLSKHALISLGSEVVPFIRNALTSKNSMERLAAAHVVLMVSPQEKVSVDIIKNVSSALSCEDRPQLFEKIFNRVNPASHTQLINDLVTCLENPQSVEHAKTLVSALAQVKDAQSKELSNRLLELLEKKLTDPAIQFIILERYQELNLPASDVIKLITKAITTGDDTIKYRGITLLGRIGPAAGSALPVLQAIRSDRRKDDLLKNEAVVSMALIDPTAFEYRKFFEDELLGDEYRFAPKVLGKLPLDALIPILSTWITRADVEQRTMALDTAGKLGDARLVVDIERYLGDPISEVRYSAVIALARLAPTDTRVGGLLKGLMKGVFRDRLMEESLPKVLRPTLEKIRAETNSNIERMVAEKMIEKED